MHIAHLRGIYFANNTNSVIYFQGLLDSVSDYACRNKLKAIEIYETAKFKPPENLHENSTYFIHSNAGQYFNILEILRYFIWQYIVSRKFFNIENIVFQY